jgi:hypothetical protein
MRALAEWLVAQDFVLETAHFPGTFMNYMVKLRKGALFVELASDRGVESVEMGISGFSEPLEIDLWRSCVRDRAAPFISMPARLQAEMLMEDFPLIERAVSTDPGRVAGCLRERQNVRMHEAWESDGEVADEDDDEQLEVR